MINLEKYYPQKLTLTDAVCICQETLGSLQHTQQPELLPFYILQKIMMYSYKCRTSILQILQNTVDADLDSDYGDEESDSAGDKRTNYVHPMDGLLAHTLC